MLSFPVLEINEYIVDCAHSIAINQVDKFVAPSADTLSAVNAWLSENGLTATPLTTAGDWLGFDVSVEKANELLDAQFSTFKHEETGDETVRTLAYSIPADLKDHIELVHPTITYVTQHNPLLSDTNTTPSLLASRTLLLRFLSSLLPPSPMLHRPI